MAGTGDADLARRCRAGDQAAWRTLVRAQAPLAWRLAWRVLGDAREAEDAVQETFTRVHASFDTYDPTRPLAPWIARIAWNASLRRLAIVRAQERVAVVDEADDVPDDREPGPEAARASSEATRDVAAALARLSAQDRGLLDLRYREGLTDAEVAEATGMPVGTVKTRIFRARARLKEWLGPWIVEAGR